MVTRFVADSGLSVCVIPVLTTQVVARGGAVGGGAAGAGGGTVWGSLKLAPDGCSLPRHSHDVMATVFVGSCNL